MVTSTINNTYWWRKLLTCLGLTGSLAFGGCDFGDDWFEPDPCPLGVTLSASSMEVKLGRTAYLRVVDGRDDCPVTWEGGDYKIAQIIRSNTGVTIVPRDMGEFTLEAIRGSGNGGGRKSCLVKVVVPNLVSMSIGSNLMYRYVFIGSENVSRVKTVFLDDENIEISIVTGVEWSSEDSTIAGIHWADNGLADIRGFKEGETNITASYLGPGTNGETLTAMLLVKVLPAPE